jgi:hypothetical protein
VRATHLPTGGRSPLASPSSRPARRSGAPARRPSWGAWSSLVSRCPQSPGPVSLRVLHPRSADPTGVLDGLADALARKPRSPVMDARPTSAAC